MDLFNLPRQTVINRVVPKNAFDKYTNTKQKALFSSLILRITWTNKLSEETINLKGQEISEIQVFKIELKEGGDPKSLLDLIDKSIPYHIIFIVSHNGNVFLSTSKKHPHPTNDDNSVIDWTFRSDWFTANENQFSLNLKKSIDAVYQDFCNQLSGNFKANEKSISELIDRNKEVDKLNKEISSLKSAISKCKQFNQKVELNMKLKEVEAKLEHLCDG
ncbi:DUF4391 domain-containing protein [Echinicola marina]|uniref:DUF4391 domain-containing protein n=1 Tax=Echinicola marina TaxID=2859768 RepID=UPI001CF67036|nr:DUF4391 domain-containing protein [Echinicola marina]UCS92495.1 DUF4391 domain-containing protein [Echinicola marina]